MVRAWPLALVAIVIPLLFLMVSCGGLSSKKPPQSQPQPPVATDRLSTEGEVIRAISSQDGYCNAEAINRSDAEVLTLYCGGLALVTLPGSVPVRLSADGSQMLYVHSEQGAAAALYLYDRRSSTVTQLTNVGISANVMGRQPTGWVPIPADYDAVTWTNTAISYTAGGSKVTIPVSPQVSP